MDETQKLLAELGITDQQPNEDPFAHLQPEPEKEVVVEEKPTEDEDKEFKNRRERRLNARLEAERQSSMQLAAKLEAITEANKVRNESKDADYLQSVDRIWGSDTPENATATELLKNAIKGAREDAKNEALEVFRKERDAEREALAKEERELDTMIEDIEDEFNIDLSTEKAQPIKQGFFKLLEKMSPKDEHGNITHYADAHAVWEIYNQGVKKTDNNAKDKVTRSMTQSGASAPTKLEDDALQRILRENGII